jgi:hypothetical protein
MLAECVEPRTESVRAAERALQRRASAAICPMSTSASIFSFDGAGVVASPRISVVTPCVTLLITRPSRHNNASHEWPCTSMKPGATMRPRAFTLCAAELSRSAPGSVTATMRSPLMATSPYIHGLPVPSTMRPFSMITSNGPDMAGVGAVAGRVQAVRTDTAAMANWTKRW